MSATRIKWGLVLLFWVAVCHPASALSSRSEDEAPVPVKIILPGVQGVEVETGPDGSHRFTVTPKNGLARTVSPTEFARLVHDTQSSVTFWERILNISSPVGIAWVLLGFLGQVMFTGRMVVQWLISEREKRSVVPVAFWWLSLAGGMMLLIYFIWRKDIVGIIGQSTGTFIYSRNLILIYRKGI